MQQYKCSGNVGVCKSMGEAVGGGIQAAWERSSKREEDSGEASGWGSREQPPAKQEDKTPANEL